MRELTPAGCVMADMDDNDDDEHDEEGPPECLLDCEGIENVDPEQNGMYFCEWLITIFPSGCAEDCDQEILNDIEEFMQKHKYSHGFKQLWSIQKGHIKNIDQQLIKPGKIKVLI